MIRSILVVLLGVATWSALWLVENQTVAAVFPDSFAEDGTTQDAGLLVLILALSVVDSLVAGFVTAALSKKSRFGRVLAVGLVLLAIGIMVQVGYWELMPVWYHLSFLALLVPATLIGGSLRRGSKAG